MGVTNQDDWIRNMEGRPKLGNDPSLSVTFWVYTNANAPVRRQNYSGLLPGRVRSSNVDLSDDAAFAATATDQTDHYEGWILSAGDQV